MNAPLYDAHNHLQDEWLRPHLATVLADLHALDLQGAIVNGTEESDWPDVTRLAREHSWVWPSFGLHPWRVRGRTAHWRETMQRHLDEAGSRVAIGEIGLDRWIPDHDLDDQREVFVWQLRLAAERNLPATIHCLQAWGALEAVLRIEPVPDCGFLLHAYGGPAEMVGTFARRGAYFSFNGAHLHPRKEARRALFREIPLERLLVETDAPAMPPPPGHITHPLPPAPGGEVVNHPANLAHIYGELAALRSLPVAELATRVEANFHRLFG